MKGMNRRRTSGGGGYRKTVRKLEGTGILENEFSALLRSLGERNGLKDLCSPWYTSLFTMALAHVFSSHAQAVLMRHVL